MQFVVRVAEPHPVSSDLAVQAVAANTYGSRGKVDEPVAKGARPAEPAVQTAYFTIRHPTVCALDIIEVLRVVMVAPGPIAIVLLVTLGRHLLLRGTAFISAAGPARCAADPFRESGWACRGQKECSREAGNSPFEPIKTRG